MPHRVHQVVEGDSLPAIAYREYGQPAHVAGGGRPEPDRRPDAAAAGRPAAAAAAGGAGALAGPASGRRRDRRGGCSMAHGEEFSNTLLVKVDGTPLPDDIKPLLVSGYVDDSTNVPDMFVLRFTDDGGTVLAKAKLRDRREGRAEPPVHRPGGPAVAPQGRGDGARGRGGREGHAHRGAGPGRVAPAVPRHPDRGVRQHDRLRHRDEGRPAGRPQVHGRRDDGAARPHQPGRRQRLGLPAPARGRARPRAHR